MVAEKFEAEVESVRLIFNSKKLVDTNTIESYKIGENAIVITILTKMLPVKTVEPVRVTPPGQTHDAMQSNAMASMSVIRQQQLADPDYMKNRYAPPPGYKSIDEQMKDYYPVTFQSTLKPYEGAPAQVPQPQA